MMSEERKLVWRIKEKLILMQNKERREEKNMRE